MKSWMYYKDGVWRKENMEQSSKAAAFVARQQMADHPTTQTDLATSTKIRNYLRLAKSMMAIGSDEFDRVPGILNFQNGTMDLASGELMPHDPGHFLTVQIPYDWDEKAICPVWESHLQVMCKGRGELVELLQLAAGMSLWGGSDRDQVFFHLRGKGRNGKGVFIRALIRALGGYGVAAPVNLLTMADGAHTTEFMRLRGKRFACVSEVGTKRLNLNVLKMLTGGDDITARAMRQDNVTFSSTWVLWIATNYSLNTVGDSSDALWERYVPIDLGDMIPADERDSGIEEKIRLEIEGGGVIRWAVEGFRKWREAGRLVLPDFVRGWCEDERENSDVFGAYVDERLVVHSERSSLASEKILLSDIALDYQLWAEKNGEGLKMSSKAIAADLRTRYGLLIKPGTNNKRTVYNVSWLRDESVGL